MTPNDKMLVPQYLHSSSFTLPRQEAQIQPKSHKGMEINIENNIINHFLE